jgi:hypothetical protein
MREINRPSHEQHSSFGGGGSIFAIDDEPDGMATVSSGPYSESLPVAGRTVGEIRTRYRDRFDIAPRGQATLNGSDVGDDAVVRAGQMLAFVHRIGEKGGH